MTAGGFAKSQKILLNLLKVSMISATFLMRLFFGVSGSTENFIAIFISFLSPYNNHRDLYDNNSNANFTLPF
jgi:hypothetical protein